MVNSWEKLLYDPTTAFVISIIDYMLLALFLTEMVLKLVAYGVLWEDSHTYFRGKWNVLDFISVVPSVFAAVFGGTSIEVLRMFRVLRPLKAMRSSAGMRLVVSTLLGVIPSMGAITGLMVFVIFVFGAIGLQLWAGRLKYQCAAYGVEIIALPSTLQQLVPNLTFAYRNVREADAVLANASFLPALQCDDTDEGQRFPSVYADFATTAWVPVNPNQLHTPLGRNTSNAHLTQVKKINVQIHRSYFDSMLVLCSVLHAYA